MKAHRDRLPAGVIAIGAALTLLVMKPLSLISCICAAMFALGVYPTVANLMSRARGDSPSIAVYKDEGGTTARDGLGSIVGPASFAVIACLLWFAS